VRDGRRHSVSQHQAALLLDQPVDIQFTPEKSGDVAFACGMGMFKGTLVVR
jgi:plastocyanin domain-containing protein